MPTRFVTTSALTLALACPGAFAQAQETPQPDKPQPQPTEPAAPPPAPPPEPESAKLDLSNPPWTFSIEPGAWFVGAGGRLQMPRSAPQGTPNQRFDIANLNFDNPRFVPFGEVNARKGDWRIALRGFYYDATKNASGNAGQIGDVVFTPADTLRSSMTFASYELEGAYTIMGGQSNKLDNGVYAVAAKLDLVGGVRVYDVDWTITNTSGGPGPSTTSDDGIFVQPEFGAKLSVDIYRDVTIDLQLTFGGIPTGSNRSYSGDIIAGLMYNPTPHVGVQAGYRALFFGVSKGDGEGEFSFNGAMQGLYGSLVFRF
jgi:hypothetical protein